MALEAPELTRRRSPQLQQTYLLSRPRSIILLSLKDAQTNCSPRVGLLSRLCSVRSTALCVGDEAVVDNDRQNLLVRQIT